MYCRPGEAMGIGSVMCRLQDIGERTWNAGYSIRVGWTMQ